MLCDVCCPVPCVLCRVCCHRTLMVKYITHNILECCLVLYNMYLLRSVCTCTRVPSAPPRLLDTAFPHSVRCQMAPHGRERVENKIITLDACWNAMPPCQLVLPSSTDGLQTFRLFYSGMKSFCFRLYRLCRKLNCNTSEHFH